jgi:hypothetical protein
MPDGVLMNGIEAASKSFFHVALRFHDGQPMIYSTIAKRMFVQTNDSLVTPVFEEITWELEDCLSCDDWEPWTEPLPN